MRILLVQSRLDQVEFQVFPLGLAYLAAVLTGHEVQVLDLNAVADPLAELRDRLRSFSPRVVGLSLRNVDNLLRLEFCNYYRNCFQPEVRLIRGEAPEASLVVGGSGFSLYAREIMEDNPEIDCGVYLEGEESFPELLDRLDRPESVLGVFYRRDGQVAFTGARPLPDFARLPWPERGFMDPAAYSDVTGIGVQATRGCPLNCVYCVYPALSGGRLRGRPARDVVDEIEHLFTRHGVDHFFFADSAFGTDLEQSREICRLLIERGLPVRWGANFDLRHGDDEFFRLAARAGCRDFAMSPDGYSQAALRGLGKGLTTQAVRHNIELFLSDPQLKRTLVIYTFFICPPGETLGGLLKSLWFWAGTMARLRLAGRRGNVSFDWIRIEPGTGVHRLALAQGDLRPGQPLLPPPEGDPRDHLFYRHPRLRTLDGVLRLVMRLLGAAKRALKSLRGRRSVPAAPARRG